MEEITDTVDNKVESEKPEESSKKLKTGEETTTNEAINIPEKVDAPEVTENKAEEKQNSSEDIEKLYQKELEKKS